MKPESVWAVIPAHNEEKNIKQVISKTKKFVDKVVAVDDGSKDNTANLAKDAGAIVLKHIVNLGKGAALKTGCEYAVKNQASIIICIDADAQHDPQEVPRFIEEIKNHDIVFGSRKRTKNMPSILRLGNKFLSEITKILYNVDLSDTQSGYRAFRADIYKKIRWNSTDYSMESEMIANVGKHKLRYKEIIIKTIYSDKYKGTTVIDGIKIAINMLFWKLKR